MNDNYLNFMSLLKDGLKNLKKDWVWLIFLYFFSVLFYYKTPLSKEYPGLWLNITVFTDYIFIFFIFFKNFRKSLYAAGSFLLTELFFIGIIAVQFFILKSNGFSFSVREKSMILFLGVFIIFNMFFYIFSPYFLSRFKYLCEGDTFFHILKYSFFGLFTLKHIEHKTEYFKYQFLYMLFFATLLGIFTAAVMHFFPAAVPAASIMLNILTVYFYLFFGDFFYRWDMIKKNKQEREK